MTSNALEDFKIPVKIKLSALWTSVTLCYLYGDYFELYLPKKVEGIISGESMLNSPMKLFAASVLLAIPAVMVFLSILTKPSINRWLNITLGIFFTAIMVLIALASMTYWRTFYVFFAILEAGITSLIVWYAWRWPKEDSQSH